MSLTFLRSIFRGSNFVYLLFTYISQLSIGIGICPTFVLLFVNLSYKYPTIRAIFFLPVLLCYVKSPYFPTYQTLKVGGKYSSCQNVQILLIVDNVDQPQISLLFRQMAYIMRLFHHSINHFYHRLLRPPSPLSQPKQ